MLVRIALQDVAHINVDATCVEKLYRPRPPQEEEKDAMLLCSKGLQQRDDGAGR